MEESKQYTVVILLFENVEVLDFAGPFEVFSLAGEYSDEHIFKVVTAAPADGPLQTRNGLSVNPDFRLVDCPQADLLVVPGGQGTRALLKQPEVLDWIAAQAAGADWLTSVCTGALPLGKLGLLNGRDVVTHHSALDELRDVAPKAFIDATERFIDTGKVVTSGGISAGIDMALHMVERIGGAELAKKVRTEMEYADWRH